MNKGPKKGSIRWLEQLFLQKREALIEYGNHLASCRKCELGVFVIKPCTCGLESELYFCNLYKKELTYEQLLEEKIKRLSEALKRYGGHRNYCRDHDPDYISEKSGACGCGFSQTKTPKL